MPKNSTVAAFRMAIAGAITMAMLAGFFAFPRVAFAHHIEIVATHTCDTYAIRADYVGGSGDRYAMVTVNGVASGTYDFPGSGPDVVDDFFVLAGDLPADVTVEVRLYIPRPGPGELESTAFATVDEDLTCTPTATPSATATPVATLTPSTTPIPSSTAAPTETPTAIASATATPSGHETNTPVATPTAAPSETPRAATQTPVVTATPTTGTAETPTFVSTVESLLPPAGPGTGTTPPQETASGLPNTGAGTVADGIVVGLGLLMMAAAGLAFATLGLRRQF